MSGKKWEYKTELFAKSSPNMKFLAETLNLEGNEGWELVSVIDHNDKYNLVYKRERELTKREEREEILLKAREN